MQNTDPQTILSELARHARYYRIQADQAFHEGATYGTPRYDSTGAASQAAMTMLMVALRATQPDGPRALSHPHWSKEADKLIEQATDL
ncbi:hypothetical protein HII36_29655 [Nonomuraea sp. NN258]|uniref:hypothetical protein n=1 Tax=Nonomuraea antri TaxID=2730852 RepID=UPI00156A72D6|nr:hypothetical protein [Nonomuraea antri]NRQ35967.1 hypothetical protein [Nonomuraea antri]